MCICSPMHEDTNRFCQQVLYSRCVGTLPSHGFVVGGHLGLEAYFLSQQLRVSTYPFMAILMPKSETMVEIADRIQGKIEATSLCAF